MTKTIRISGQDRPSDLFIGDHKAILPTLLPDTQLIYLTDENVFSSYHSFFANKQTLVIPPGENSKNWDFIGKLHQQLLGRELDRSGFLVGMGGGVVTDICGFLGSTFMRGIRFGFVSTSLVGQVDAVIGGKNGVNLDGYKNIIGTFNHPEFIICDPVFLQTLPKNEMINGAAEVIKQFAIAEKNSLYWFRDHLINFENRDSAFLSELVYRQCKIKATIVEEDPRESGKRKWLNFGHSFGHAIERENKWPHGFSVGAGMVLAAKISEKLGYLEPDELNFLTELIAQCHLPVHPELPLEDLLDTLRKDKKRKGDQIDFIVLKGLGQAAIHPLTFVELEKLCYGIQ